jgi:hypothetical protein
LVQASDHFLQAGFHLPRHRARLAQIFHDSRWKQPDGGTFGVGTCQRCNGQAGEQEQRQQAGA